MSWLKSILPLAVFLILDHVTGADVMVQLNINRPINDVSDKFISFAIKPEDLYKALDSSNRKTLTRMATMLSNSHVKFVGDYYFAAKTEGIRLRNPTKIVWKGFNKWTKAVNWSMIIPVPYNPNNWDPMETLKILNTSQMVDIDEAIWQLGTDFGTSQAADYVSELKTFNLMVESFKHTASNWQTMGADISAGSSPEETSRYIEMSRDLNAAYGWIQSDDVFTSNSLGSSLEGQDSALQVLFRSKVPVWLTLPKNRDFLLHMNDEVNDGLEWAQTMGDAAHMGFDSIFKPLSLDDLERPNFSFFVTALFKKIMGSRVYPAQTMGPYSRNNKLYTHCASMISGGLSLMVINKQEEPLQISVRNMNKIQDNDVWQYSLTMRNGQVMLNNKILFINSTLTPEVRRKNTKFMLQLRTPGLSVSFWVLPNANLEHCHFTEIETPIKPDEFNQKVKRYSSSDRLLKELIKETTKQTSYSPLASLLSRQRRSVHEDDRFKRFVLEGSHHEVKPFSKLADNFVQEIKTPLKRDIYSLDRRIIPIEWLSNIFKEPLNLDLPLLRRNARQSDTLKGPFFMTRDGKKIAFIKKIREIKKPEKKVKKLLSEDQEFDEEKFFKSVDEQPVPAYVPLPDGDVFLSHIVSVDGDDDELTIETRKSKKPSGVHVQEIVSEIKPLRLLPTNVFEALPAKPNPSLLTKSNFGSSLNADQFGKNLKRDASAKEIEKEVHAVPDTDEEADVLKAEIDMTHKILRNRSAPQEEEANTDKNNEDLVEAYEVNSQEQNKSLPLDFFEDPTKTESDKLDESDNKSVQSENSNGDNYDEKPWWDLSAKRFKRSIHVTSEPRDSWHDNMISKGDDPKTAANELTPTRLRRFEQKVNEAIRNTNHNSADKETGDTTFGSKIVSTFKEHVTKLVDLFSHHASEWYNTLTKHFDTATDENVAIAGNRVA